ncbi:MAG: phosphate acyltransferase PlsX [Rhodospirillales bacterium]|nr:phosphate acyltransferase PlsX [Rhodospirillales bacterium]
MTKRLTLSLDAMGGDQAPRMVVEGVEIAAERFPDVDYLLVGDERRLAPLLDRFPKVRARAQILHTDTAVADEDKAAAALRNGRGTSMRLAINAVAEGRADAVISAGNTGALMAMAKFVFKMLPGIDRPAIVTYFPTQRGASVMLDLGANVECDAANLVQFAVMGEVFARNVLGVKQPSIGLLNVGVEGFKGHDSLRQASTILRESALPIKFHGFVEGDDIGEGTVDVIVTDGFTGNVALKTAEGTARMVGHFLRAALSSSTMSKVGALLAKGALNEFRTQMDPRRYNGAMLVGLNGICVKSHGSTDDLGFANAIGVAANLITGRINERIKEDLEQLISGGSAQTAATTS